VRYRIVQLPDGLECPDARRPRGRRCRRYASF
jgi:hypothetical protein